MARTSVPKIPACNLAVLAITVIAGCSESEPPRPADAVIHNVSIVDVSSGTVLAGKAVVVEDGRISQIVDEHRVHDFMADTLIDGEGNFLMPALADVHVHIQSPSELQNYVRYGVGLVVNMSGGRQHLAMRDAVASGEALGPQIATMGPTLDGDPPTNPLFTTINPGNADEVITWIDEQGFDAIKVYQQMDVGTLRAAIQAGLARGLITSGHVSREAGIEQVLDAGQRYIAHGEDLAFEAFDEGSWTYDLAAVPSLADRLLEAGITLTPMLAYLENIPQQATDLQAYLDSEQMRLVPAATRISFDTRQGWFSNRDDPESFAAQIGSLVDFVAALTVALHERGVSQVLGTDAGFGGAIPGYSVHEELATLVDAGLPEIDALRMATLDAGEFLGEIDPSRAPWGQVVSGYAASLVLVGGNPLDDIAVTQDIRGVMVDGRWIGADALANLEADIVRRQEVLLPLARQFDEAIVAGDPDAAQAVVALMPDEMAGEPLISADNCIFLGYRHFYGGNRPVAGRLYELCAAMHPESSPLWIHIAQAHESNDNPEAAVQAYRRANELNPWYGDPQSAIDRLSEEIPFGNN